MELNLYWRNKALQASLHFFYQAEDGIRDGHVTGVQTCALPISRHTAVASNGCRIFHRWSFLDRRSIQNQGVWSIRLRQITPIGTASSDLPVGLPDYPCLPASRAHIARPSSNDANPGLNSTGCLVPVS